MTDLELRGGSVLAGYRIERKLGEGGMGAVYLARDPDLSRHDAVKVLSAELSRDPEFRARFVREADVAARLSHPNIVAVYRRGETPAGQLWIAMQFVDGQDADAALRAGTMTPQRAVDIIGQVASALDYAHGQRVLHRDIKPANFLLARESAEERALLADFGIARALDEIGLTGGGQVMSTVAYAAPEVLTGTPVDYRADLYSLGCSLFKLLTGNIPFWKAAGAPAVMLAHLGEPPPRVTDLEPDLPPALNEVIATAMAKEPSLRYRTAGELAWAANVALRSGDHTAKWRVNISGTADPAASATPPAPASPGPPHPDPRKARGRKILAAAAGIGLTAAVAVTGLTVAARRASLDIHEAPRNTAIQPFSMQKLPGLLPSAADLDAVLGKAMTIKGVITAMGVDSKAIDNQDCAEPWTAAQKVAYFGSGWQALEYQPAQETHPAPAPFPMVYSFVAVVSFPLAELAQRFVEHQKPVWQNCVGQPVTFTGQDHMQFPGHFGDRFSVNDGNVLTMSLNMSDVWFSCGRGLTARNNVVIDIAVCNSTDPSDAVATLIKHITDRVPH